jgi:hypothetical protein
MTKRTCKSSPSQSETILQTYNIIHLIRDHNGLLDILKLVDILETGRYTGKWWIGLSTHHILEVILETGRYTTPLY